MTKRESNSGARGARSSRVLELPALRIDQGNGRHLLSFAVDGKILSDFATISRVKRDEHGEILGYQRPEVASHISEIRSYLESESPMIPNAVVIAFDDRVTFKASEGSRTDTDGYTSVGTISIPIDPTLADQDKPGWVVDGQQRLAAIRDAAIDRFPICAVGFVARDDSEQREQFILVNSTKPLPKGLIYELLPTTSAQLPTLLQRRRFPSLLLARLNSDEDSPLRGMIKTPTVPDGTIRDNSIMRMIENSLSDGILYRFRGGEGGPDAEEMLSVLKAYWSAVRDTFASAWGLPPRRSRLMHGAGIVSLGFIMDAIADRHRSSGVPNQSQFSADLRAIEAQCRWTDGYWEFGPGVQRKWNDIQNTSKDIQLLSNYLLVQYRARVWSRSAQSQSL